MTSPPVPPGPGVRPPFAAAPVEGRSARLWLGLGVAGGALALCCGAGFVSCAGVLITGVEALNEQAHRAVGDYLDAKVDQDWQEAYELRCEQDQEQESLAQYTDRVANQAQIESYEMADVDATAAQEILLPVDIEYVDGQQEQVMMPLVQDPETGMLEVCGLAP